ncbi:MAG TPA: hypothetical protein VNP98_13050 [Chthoniobacterales bacterium]|nr:hypothetical protein [Chthoniobacterales bacterium]
MMGRRAQCKTPARGPAFWNTELSFDLVTAVVAAVLPEIAAVIPTVLAMIASVVTSVPAVVAAIFSANVTAVNPTTP